MAFPKSFYRQQKKVGVRRTATPTGVLSDPTDLIDKPRPWITIEEGLSTEEPLKKTLIFADHLFKYRDPKEQKQIMKRLRDATSQGFRVLVQSPDSQLKEWDGVDVPSDYSLDLSTFRPEVINGLAWTQKNLSAENIFVLDYWGMNELTGKERQVLNWGMFVEHHQDFQTLVSSAPENSFRLKFSRDPENQVSQFLKFFSENRSLLPNRKFTDLDLSEAKVTAEDLSILHGAIPNLEKLKLREKVGDIVTGEPNLSGCFKGLEMKPLTHLKDFSFLGASSRHSEDFTADDLGALLKSPSLEKISIALPNKPPDFFQQFKPGDLSHIKEFHLTSADQLTKEDIIAILKAMPNVEKISLFCRDFDLTKEFKELQGKMLHLKEINITSNTPITPQHLAAWQEIAPAASISLEAKFSSFAKEEKEVIKFHNCKMIKLRTPHKKAEIIGLLNATPMLEKLFMSRSDKIHNFTDVFTHPDFSKDNFKYLKEIGFSSAYIDEKDLIALLRAAPVLEKFDYSDFDISSSDVFNHFTPGELNHLKEIRCSTKTQEIGGQEAVSLFHKDLELIASAAPAVETLEIILPTDEEKRIPANVFQQLKPQQFPKLTTLNIKMNFDEAKFSLSLLGIKMLLAAAPLLEEITFPTNLKISIENLDHLKPHERDRLIELGFPRVIFFPEEAVAASLEEKTTVQTTPAKESYGMSAFKTFNNNNFETKEDPAKKLSFIEYFPSVEPSLYRHRVWSPNLDTCDGPGEFKPSDFKRIPIPEDNLEFKEYACHPGSKQTKPEDGNHIILPSLDAEEQLSKLEVFDSHGKLIDRGKIQLEYSKSTQFYRLVLPEPGNFQIRFQVAVPAPGLKSQRPALPTTLQDMVNKYRTYQPSKKDLPKKNHSTLREFAKYLQKHKTGSCWQRSVAAFEELESQPEFRGKERVRIAVNAVHAFIEVRVKSEVDQSERWYPLDLDGYPVTLEKLPEKQPAVTQKEQPKLTSPVDTIPFPIAEKAMEPLLQAENKPCLILAANDLAAHTFYTNLRKTYPSEDIFIAHEPEKISLSGASMTEEGEVKKAYTDLSRWLETHEQKAGAVVVDVRQFNETELVQLNDFLDGRIEKRRLPEQLRVILLDDPARGYYGPDFRRRVPTKSRVMEPVNRELLAEKKDNLRDEKNVVEIDLFNSLYWQLNLLGNWQIKETKESDSLSFHWNKGSLLTELAAQKKHIVFKNPPLHDPRFTRFMAELQSLRRIQWADQAMTLPDQVQFYQTTGYDWEPLRKLASLHNLSHESPKAMPVLSDANILSFINDPSYSFSQEANRMESCDSHLTRCKKKSETLDLVCSPGLSRGSLAQLMSAAKERGVNVRIFTADAEHLPKHSPLNELFVKTTSEQKVSAGWTSQSVSFQLADDLYYAARKALHENKGASCFDLSSLTSTELGRFPAIDKRLQQNFLETGKLKMQAPFSAIIEKLQKGETVILQGKIPPTLYEALTTLSLGFIEGKPIPGKLLIIAPLDDAPVIKAISGQPLTPGLTPEADKISLLQKLYPAESKELKAGAEKLSFADLERRHLKEQLEVRKKPLVSQDTLTQSDEKRAQEFDDVRLYNTQQALALNPWVMIEGSTGIGKTYFLETVLPTSKTETPIYDFTTWLTAKPENGKNPTLVMDEASFLSQLSGEGENFLERFKGLRGKPPGMLWKGVYYPLTEQHKVIFTFNPASYGAGRSTSGFLTEQALPLSFQRLPDYYVRERIMAPLFLKNLPDEFKQHPKWLTDPLIHVYRWILNQNPKESLITPREIKAMVHLISSHIGIIKDETGIIKDKTSLETLARDAAYTIGRQALIDSPQLLQQFDANFKPTNGVLNRKKVHPNYADHRREAYLTIQQLLTMRKCLVESKDPANTDMGLGGIVLEGGAGIGKSYFVEKVVEELQKEGQAIYRISATTSYSEKESLLRKAFTEGAIVIADEINTSLWPNKLLNNFLMGLDEDNKPAKSPGFMLIATQNPPSFVGRSEEDPALRRRLIKLKLDWAVRIDAISSSAFKKDLDKLPNTFKDFNKSVPRIFRNPSKDKEHVREQPQRQLTEPHLEDSSPDQGNPPKPTLRRSSSGPPF